jgi:ubiquinone/menaquinone biosynthesis C-methylase UbiE
MQRLAHARELLDGELEPRDLTGTMRDLARVNRWLDGANLSWRAIEPLLAARDAPLRLVDVGTGAADIPRDLLKRAAQRRAFLRIVATDSRSEIVELAQRWSVGVPRLSFGVAAGAAIAAADGDFDVAHASLVLHHLEPPDAVALLTEMARVARRAVIVNDLERGRLWLVGAWLLSRVATRNRYTRHDAPLSVRRAYSQAEMVALAASAGLRPVARYRARPPYRYALVFAHRTAHGG